MSGRECPAIRRLFFSGSLQADKDFFGRKKAVRKS